MLSLRSGGAVMELVVRSDGAPPGRGSEGGVRGRRMLASVPESAPPPRVCTDYTTGQSYPCFPQQYPVLVIVVAGLVSMLFLISVALLMLYCSYYKRRHLRSEGVSPASQVAPANAAASAAGPDSTAYDDLVLVYMPGDELAVFARPAPLTGDSASGEDLKVKISSSNGEVEQGDYTSGAAAVKECDVEASPDGQEMAQEPKRNIVRSLSLSRQGSFRFQELGASSSSAREGFRFSTRHASFRFERDRSFALELEGHRSFSFPRRADAALSGSSVPQDARRVDHQALLLPEM